MWACRQTVITVRVNNKSSAATKDLVRLLCTIHNTHTNRHTLRQCIKLYYTVIYGLDPLIREKFEIKIFYTHIKDDLEDHFSISITPQHPGHLPRALWPTQSPGTVPQLGLNRENFERQAFQYYPCENFNVYGEAILSGHWVHFECGLVI